MKKIIIALFAVLVCGGVVQAEKVKNVKILSAEYTYRGPENESVSEAKRKAVERAKINALADEYGTVLSQTNTTKVSNVNGSTDTDFQSFGFSEVKGVWLADVDESQFSSVSFEQGMIVVTVKVKGKACAVKHNDIDLRVYLLRNGVDKKFQSAEFVHRDQLRILFQSPVAGYLAVYQLDEDGKAFCLLPYPEQDGVAYKVKANKEYLLFDYDAACDAVEKETVVEYEMLTSRSHENNEIYVLFSPNPFSKASDSRSDNSLPRELTADNFQKWMAKCRLHDEQMQLSRFPITIRQSE